MEEYQSPIFSYKLSDKEMSALLSVMKDWLDDRRDLITELSKESWARADKIYTRLRDEFYHNVEPEAMKIREALEKWLEKK